jgi:hypothetical protein
MFLNSITLFDFILLKQHYSPWWRSRISPKRPEYNNKQKERKLKMDSSNKTPDTTAGSQTDKPAKTIHDYAALERKGYVPVDPVRFLIGDRIVIKPEDMSAAKWASALRGLIRKLGPHKKYLPQFSPVENMVWGKNHLVHGLGIFVSHHFDDGVGPKSRIHLICQETCDLILGHVLVPAPEAAEAKTIIRKLWISDIGQILISEICFNPNNPRFDDATFEIRLVDDKMLADLIERNTNFVKCFSIHLAHLIQEGVKKKTEQLESLRKLETTALRFLRHIGYL